MIRVDTYAELVEFLEAFKRGEINLLIVESKGGLGKTSLAEEVLGDEAIYFKGHTTPLALYKRFVTDPYGFGRERDVDGEGLLVFDDVEDLFQNKSMRSLLKQLWDTREVKKLTYNTSKRGVPPEVETKAKSLVLTNDLLLGGGSDLKALRDRATVIYFCPGKDEVERHIRGFDGVDLEVLGEVLEESRGGYLSIRCYVKALELKEAGLDWESYVGDVVNDGGV